MAVVSGFHGGLFDEMSVFATISFFANNLLYKCSTKEHQKILNLIEADKQFLNNQANLERFKIDTNVSDIGMAEMLEFDKWKKDSKNSNKLVDQQTLETIYANDPAIKRLTNN